MPVNPFAWECPYCGRSATITDENYSDDIHYFEHGNKDGFLGFATWMVVCPNTKCKEYTIDCALYKAFWDSGERNIDNKKQLLRIRIRPTSNAKVFPSYVPQAIRDDYTEACQIREMSPKASATLSRRCLQGMIRDFWKVSERNLKLEIEAIKDKVDPLTWEAIDAVREVGNIGAHMEKDINLIVDIEPKEAELLIGLIETLIGDWYVTRQQRQVQLEEIKKLGGIKQKAREGGNEDTSDVR